MSCKNNTMTPLHDFLLRSLAIGIGATALLDAFSAIRARVFGAPFPNYPMVGRWLGHFPSGQFVQANMGKAAPVAGEGMIGWTVHYATGVVFAAALLSLCGLEWARDPTLTPALVFGLVTVAAPFLLMQPGMGLGLASAKAPNPAVARMRSISSHLVFGAGLYVSALVLARAVPA